MSKSLRIEADALARLRELLNQSVTLMSRLAAFAEHHPRADVACEEAALLIASLVSAKSEGGLLDDALALLSAEDALPTDPGTLTVTYGARSFTVSPVSRSTYDAVCTVLQRAAPAQE